MPQNDSKKIMQCSIKSGPVLTEKAKAASLLSLTDKTEIQIKIKINDNERRTEYKINVKIITLNNKLFKIITYNLNKPEYLIHMYLRLYTVIGTCISKCSHMYFIVFCTT